MRLIGRDHMLNFIAIDLQLYKRFKIQVGENKNKV